MCDVAEIIWSEESMTKKGAKLLKKLVRAELRFTANLGRAAVRYEGIRKSKRAVALKTA